jgi:hypothetical protein
MLKTRGLELDSDAWGQMRTPTRLCQRLLRACIGPRSSLRRISLLAALATSVALLSGCGDGQTDPATDVTATSATLHGHVSYNPDSFGTMWWEYSKDDGATWTRTAPVHWGDSSSCATDGPRVNKSVSKPVFGLTPSAYYLFRLAGTVCYTGTRWWYADSSGFEEGGDPPYEYDSFTTRPSGFSTYQPTVSAEFTGPAGSQPDTQKWYFYPHCQSPGPPYWQHSTTCFRPDKQHIFKDGTGKLHLRAIHNWVDPGGDCWCTYGNHWTSGRIDGRHTVPPPYVFEARAKVAPGYGMWNGLAWMTNDSAVPYGAYNDVDFEQLGRQPYGINQTVADGGSVRGITRFTEPPIHGKPLSQGFHVYAAYVYATRVDFYIDGTFQTEIKQGDLKADGSPLSFAGMLYPSTFHISLDQGSCNPNYPSWPGCPTSYNRRDLIVDWIRVYTR